jgi:histidyl-tRNA synthetase
MKTYEPVRGMRDFLPEDLIKRRKVEEEARRLFRLYGYEEIETPLVESSALLSAKAGDEIRHRMYEFKDLGGRKIALRPEMTASVARIVANRLRSEPKPIRLGYIANCFRYDNPQMGRYREFWQAGYELFGSSKPEADAEILTVCHDLLQRLGLNFSIKLGHVGILRGILAIQKIDESNQNTLLGLLDRGQTRTALKIMRELKIEKDCIDTIKRLQALKGTDTETVFAKGEEEVRLNNVATSALENLRKIVALVSEAGAKCPINVDLGFTRGLDYYTGMIFELNVPQIKVALGGGGRYDRLVSIFGGEPTPAVGCSPGIDRIVLAMEKMELFKTSTDTKDMFLVVPVTEAQSALSMEVASRLRQDNLQVRLEVLGRNVREALSYASQLGFAGAILLGPREAANCTATLRDLKSKTQIEVPSHEIVKEARNILASNS